MLGANSASPTGAEGLSVAFDRASKTYRTGDGKPVRALDNVTLEIEPGQVVAVSGRSGSGKSTLLHLAGALDVADSGSVTVGGQHVGDLGESPRALLRRKIGFVFQRFHLLPALSALDNVAVPVLPFRVGFDKHDRARELLAAVGLAGREHDLPSHLSGGQQQRVAIARALINSPAMLLADEPTGNLDSRTGAEVLDLIFGLHEQFGFTIMIATHDAALSARCKRVIRLCDGALVSDELAMS